MNFRENFGSVWLRDKKQLSELWDEWMQVSSDDSKRLAAWR